MQTPPPLPNESRPPVSFYHRAATISLFAPMVGYALGVIVGQAFNLFWRSESQLRLKCAFSIFGVCLLVSFIFGVLSLMGIRQCGARGILWKSLIGIGMTVLTLVLGIYVYMELDYSEQRSRILQELRQHS